MVTFIPKEIAWQSEREFQKRNFFGKRFLILKILYNSEDHALYILHSFLKPGEKDVVFKAITTTPKSLLKNPTHMINYIHHGRPCENRSRGVSSYPTCSDFWKDFYDKLSEKKQDIYPMPSSPWREKFILKKYFGK